MDAKFGSFNAGTGILNSTQEITTSFQPKIIFFWWNGRSDSSDAVGGASHHRGFGVATSTSARYCYDTRSVDASGSAASSGYMHNAACIMAHTDTTVDGLIDVSAIGSTSFTLIVDDVMPYDLRVHYLALGGSDVVNAACGTVTSDASTGKFVVSGLGWQPNFAMIFGGQSGTSIPAGSATNSIFALGMASGTSNMASIVAGTDDASATMDAAAWGSDSKIYPMISNAVGTTLASSAALDSFDSGGFTIGTGFPTSTYLSIYVALNCTNVTVGNSATRTDTNTWAISGLGWQPAAGLIISHTRAESSGTTMDRNDETSIGGFSSATARGAMAVLDVDNIADSQVATAVEHDAVYANISTSDAIEGLMDISSVDSGGVTFVMDDADPAAAWFGYVFFGPASTGTMTPQTVSGGITPAATLVARANKALSGAITAAGALVNSVRKVLSGAITAAGTLANQTNKILSGELTPAGAVVAVKTTLKSLDGAITAAGAVVMQAWKVLSGAITPGGEVSKRTEKAMAGELAPAGVLSAIKVGGGIPGSIFGRERSPVFGGTIVR